LQYVGAGTASTVTVTGNTMTTTITGGPGGEDLSINLTNTSYDTLTKLLAYINGFGGGGVYEAFAMPNIDTSIASTTIQNVAALDIKTSAQNLGQTNRTLVTFNAYNTATSVYDKWQGYIPYWEWNTGIKDNLITALVPSLQLRNIGLNTIKSYNDTDKLAMYYRTGADTSQDPDLISSGTWGDFTSLTEYIDFDYQYFQLKVTALSSLLKNDKTWIRHFALHRKKLSSLTDHWKCDNISRDYSFNYTRPGNRLILDSVLGQHPYSGNPGGKYGGCYENIRQDSFADTEIAACLGNSDGSVEFYIYQTNIGGGNFVMWTTGNAIKIGTFVFSSTKFIFVITLDNGAPEIYNSPQYTNFEWVHVLLVWANGSHPKLYINNALVNTWVLTAPLNAITAVRFCNDLTSTPNAGFYGRLDEIKFYNQAII